MHVKLTCDFYNINEILSIIDEQINKKQKKKEWAIERLKTLGRRVDRLRGTVLWIFKVKYGTDFRSTIRYHAVTAKYRCCRDRMDEQIKVLTKLKNTLNGIRKRLEVGNMYKSIILSEKETHLLFS